MFALPVGSKGRCALLVPKHTQGATVNCQVYTITIHTLLQALFYRIHKKIIKAVVVFIYIMQETVRGQFFYANIRSQMRTLMRTLTRTYVRLPQNRTRAYLNTLTQKKRGKSTIFALLACFFV